MRRLFTDRAYRWCIALPFVTVATLVPPGVSVGCLVCGSALLSSGVMNERLRAYVPLPVTRQYVARLLCFEAVVMVPLLYMGMEMALSLAAALSGRNWILREFDTPLAAATQSALLAAGVSSVLFLTPCLLLKPMFGQSDLHSIRERRGRICRAFVLLLGMIAKLAFGLTFLATVAAFEFGSVIMRPPLSPQSRFVLAAMSLPLVLLAWNRATRVVSVTLGKGAFEKDSALVPFTSAPAQLGPRWHGLARVWGWEAGQVALLPAIYLVAAILTLGDPFAPGVATAPLLLLFILLVVLVWPVRWIRSLRPLRMLPLTTLQLTLFLFSFLAVGLVVVLPFVVFVCMAECLTNSVQVGLLFPLVTLGMIAPVYPVYLASRRYAGFLSISGILILQVAAILVLVNALKLEQGETALLLCALPPASFLATYYLIGKSSAAYRHKPVAPGQQPV